MTPQRWQRVREVLASALELEPERRREFLDEACAGDAALRTEVESLLDSDRQAGSFLEAPAAERTDAEGAVAGEPTPALVAGRRLGRYQILGLLGAGGMGEVYRARDLRLEREVAVKVLPRAARRDPDRLRRFEREARAAGALNHPNLLAVYDVGSEGELEYVVSELLEGATLGERLGRGPLPLEEFLDCARQIVAGLAAAHEKGIVHRDLKPQNLFLERDGRVKILDFGLVKRTPAPGAGARPEQPTLSGTTLPGALMGTLGYISPEQLQGRPADQRSDIFSLGVVLYEMLAGRSAFRGASEADTISALLRDEPEPLGRLRPDVPGWLEAVVARCLRKRPEERFQSARELRLALDASVPATPASPIDAAPARRRAIAVLPFRDLSAEADSGHLGLGLADATITELARLRSLVVRPTSTILRYRDRSADPQQVGRELAVDVVVDASFQRSGERLRVTVQLVDVREGRPLWAGKIDAGSSDLFEMQDEVARRVVQALELELTPSDARRLAGPRAPGPSAEAYELYLRGRVHLFGESLDDLLRAVDWFEKARDLEPGFALAWAGLADAYARFAFTHQPEGDWYGRAVAMCEKALAIDPTLPEGRYMRARLRWTPQGGFDHEGAVADAAPALRERPNLEEGYVFLGNVLHHVGLVDEARKLFERAEAVSPGHPRARSHVVMCLWSQGRHREALERARSVPVAGYAFQDYLIASCQLHVGELEAAERSIARMSEQRPDDILAFPLRGLIAALRGDPEVAEREVGLTLQHQKRYGHYHHAQYDVACIQALLGRPGEALNWLADAARNGYPCHTQFERDEFLASLRRDPGFARLVEESRAVAARCERLYAELRGSDAVEARAAVTPAPAARRLLAVLPFDNLSRDPEHECFSDGLTEELIGQLGRLDPDRLGVIARTSALSYKRSGKSIERIGRELGVEHVLEGSVRSDRHRLRVSARLVLVRDQSQLWSGSFERDWSDVLELQSELGRTVAAEIGLRLAPEHRPVAAAVDVEAYHAYLRGRYFWNKRSVEGFQKAIAHFEEAIRRDPGYARAHAGLSDAYALLGDVGVALIPPKQAFARAADCAARALELDETLAEAHASLAHVRFHAFDWAGSERAFQRALELDPNYATAAHWYAFVLAAAERHVAAESMMKRARALDPVSLPIATDLGVLRYYARDFDGAIEQYRKVLEMDPSFARAWVTLGTAYSRQGRHEDAVAALGKAVALAPEPAKQAALARAYAAAGRRREALDIVRELRWPTGGGYVPTYPIALIYAALGDADAAFAWLRRAREECSAEIGYLRVDPWLDSLRSDPRFEGLVSGAGDAGPTSATTGLGGKDRAELAPRAASAAEPSPEQPILEREPEGSRTPAASRPAVFAWHRAAIVAAVIAVAATAAWLLKRARPSGIGATGRPAVAVLSFEDHSRDPSIGWLSRGLPRMLVTGLAQTPGLDVISIEKTDAVLTQMGDREAGRESRLPELARRSGAGAVVVGGIYRAGSEVRIDVQLQEAASGKLLAARSVRGEDVFLLADQLSAGIRESLGLGDQPAGSPIREVTTGSLAAYQLYNEGVEARHNMRLGDARRLLERALLIDPAFSVASYHLAEIATLLGDVRQSEAYRQRAVQNLSRLPERQRVLVRASSERTSGRPERAAQMLEDLIARYPDEEEAYDLLIHIYATDVDTLPKQLTLLERWRRGVPGPASGHFHNHHGYTLLALRRYDEARRAFEAYAQARPGEANPHDSLGELQLVTGEPERALQHYARAFALAPEFGPPYLGRAWAHGMLGRYDESLAELARLESLDASSSVPPHRVQFLRAFVLSRVGRYREAEHSIEQALQLAERNQNPEAAVQAHVLDALLWLERKHPDQARESVRRAEAAAGRGSAGPGRVREAALVHLAAGLTEIRSGALEEARRRLPQRRGGDAPADARQNLWQRALAAELALAGGDPRAAEAELAQLPKSKLWFNLQQVEATLFVNNGPATDIAARARKAQGDLKGALQLYRELLHSSADSRWTALLEPRHVLEAARLLDQLGDRAAAKTEYRRFLGLWQRADPGLPEKQEASRYLGS